MVAVILSLLSVLALPQDFDCEQAYDSIVVPSTGDREMEDYWSASPEQLRPFEEQLTTLDSLRSCLQDPTLISSIYEIELFHHVALQNFSQIPLVVQDFETWFETTAPPLSDSLRGELHLDRMGFYNNLGYFYYLSGDLSQSIGSYVRALEATPDSVSRRRVRYLTDLGILSSRVRDFSAARYYYSLADSLLQTVPATSGNQKRKSRILFNLADLLATESGARNDTMPVHRALGYLRRSMEAYSEAGTYRHALQHSLLAELERNRGNLAQAYEANATALEYAVSENDQSQEALFRFKRSFIHRASGRYEDARTSLLQALELARSVQSLNLLRRVLNALGELEEALNNWSEAEQHYREAIQVMETYRLSLRATEWSSAAFSSWQGSYRSLVRVLLFQGKREEAFETLERTRARHLLDLRLRARVSRNLPLPKQARFDTLSQALADVRSELSRDVSSERESELRTRELRLRAERRDLIVMDDQPDSVSVADLQAHLARENQVLVSYFIDEERETESLPTMSYVFVLTPDALHLEPLDVTARSLRRQVESISALFTSRGKAESIDAISFDLNVLHDLYASVLAPIDSLFPEDASLRIIPDGPLYSLPFSMLLTEEPGGRFTFAEAPYLVRDRATSLELSASLITDPPSSPEASFDVAAFGVSRFPSSLQIPSSIRASITSSVDSVGNADRIRLPDLPGVRSEMNTIQRLFRKSYVALDDEATENAFHEIETQATVLHLASHAFVHPSNPLFNAFVLSSPKTSSREDGFLFLHELRLGKNSIPLVVLSGCSTARGVLRSGEGMEGLQYGFRALGAQATVSTLWPADDNSAVELTGAMYRFLQNGYSKHEALRQAQLDFLEAHPERASPFFWAPSVLYGNTQPLSLDGPPLWSYVPEFSWALFLGSVAIALVLLIAFARLPLLGPR